MKTKAYLLAFALLFATVAVCVAAEGEDSAFRRRDC